MRSSGSTSRRRFCPSIPGCIGKGWKNRQGRNGCKEERKMKDERKTDASCRQPDMWVAPELFGPGAVGDAE